MIAFTLVVFLSIPVSLPHGAVGLCVVWYRGIFLSYSLVSCCRVRICVQAPRL